MSLFQRQDKEVLGTAAIGFALMALMFGMFGFIVALHADNKKTGAPAGAVQVRRRPTCSTRLQWRPDNGSPHSCT